MREIRDRDRRVIRVVLLVIFMIVVPTMAAGTPAVPPRGTNLSARPEAEGDQTLGIDRDGRFYLNKRPIAPGDLRGRLRAIFAVPGREDHVLYVTADRGLDYGVVRDAVASASEAGVRVVGLVAEAPPPAARPGR